MDPRIFSRLVTKLLIAQARGDRFSCLTIAAKLRLVVDGKAPR